MEQTSILVQSNRAAPLSRILKQKKNTQQIKNHELQLPKTIHAIIKSIYKEVKLEEPLSRSNRIKFRVCGKTSN
jgi:hypothetical protein